MSCTGRREVAALGREMEGHKARGMGSRDLKLDP